MKVFCLLTLLAGLFGAGESTDWDSDRLAAIDPAALGYLTHSTLLVDRSGQVIWSWGDTDEPLQIFSVRKSLLSAMFGILNAENPGLLEKSLADLDIDDHLGLTETEKSATVRQLLMSRSGVYHPAAYETPGMINNRPARGQHAPGEHWYYNNWDFNALNTIFEQVSGRRIPDAFQQWLARPLGMAHFSTENVRYIVEDSSRHPAVEFWLSASDLAKFGVLMINQGQWRGRQLIPRQWVIDSTAAVSELGILGGYGHSWWSAAHGDHLPFLKFPDGTYSGRGTGEQMLLIIPGLDLVWVHLTRVTSPDQEMMHVTDTARLLKQILLTHKDGDTFKDPRMPF
ncbi:MAG: serine hydrolase [Xanthomonadales bacterium]|nr:serine hydrolase [Xanthomonadales bacterium]